MQSGDLFRCWTCEVECRGAPAGICGCGAMPGARPRGAKRGPLACVPNPARGPASPAAIVVRWINPDGTAVLLPEHTP